MTQNEETALALVFLVGAVFSAYVQFREIVRSWRR